MSSTDLLHGWKKMVDGVPGGRESLSSCHLPEGRPLLEPAMIADLLNWFARYRRHDLPWRRTRPDGRRDPWRVWLAEIMLQQTTVATVAARFDSFLTRFPDVFSLASAGEEEVMEAWAGLGYYARARHLHHAAQRIVEKWGGNFPRTFDEWAQLPGIGSYSAAAIAAIAFGEPVLPVDTNVARVLIRLHAIDRPRRHAIAEVRRRSRACRPPSGIAGDLAEALMDLGSSLCTARGRPDCSACPLHQHCEAARRGTAGQLPRRAETRERRKMAALVFCIQGPAGEVLLARRPADGLLGGMWAMPMSTPVSRDEFDPDALIRKARWRSIVFASLPRPVRHLFTHIDLQAHVVRADVPCPADIVLREGERWWPAEAARDVLPALMRKALDRAGSG